MFELFTKDLLGWLAIIFAIVSIVLAFLLRSKKPPFRMQQGGTNPIVLVDPLVGRGPNSHRIYVHPAINDQINDAYTLEAGTIDISFVGGKVVANYTKGGVDVLVDKDFSVDFKVPSQTGNTGVKGVFEKEIATKSTSESQIVALVVYSKTPGWTRAGYGLFEVKGP